MKKLTSKIMNANFKKLWICWLVICLCAALVGGGVSAALLRPQIREVVSALEEEEQGEVQNNAQNEEKDINGRTKSAGSTCPFPSRPLRRKRQWASRQRQRWCCWRLTGC